MTFLLVPHEVTDTAATIWVGAIDENVRLKAVRLQFRVDDGSCETASETTEWQEWELETSVWQKWESRRPLDRRLLARFPFNRILPSAEPQTRRLYYQRATIGLKEPLKTQTPYCLRLSIDGQPVGVEDQLGRGRVTTLPTKLPTEEDPLTLLLGSCFYSPNDPKGMVGKTYCSLSKRERPDIKILSGDQVYLDNPWKETTLKWWNAFGPPGSFREMLFKKYMDNWTQAPRKDTGFRQLLKDGANYFCSDDHEFWNNAPNIGGVALPHTLFRAQREWYFREALDLFRAFQSLSPFVKFEVDPLSFCIIDTRINRDITSRRFMDDNDLEAVRQWIEGLEAPGVLVIGQPVLTRQTSRWWYLNILSFFDKDLADYEPHTELARYIESSPHSVVVLTGDVHFGRVAWFEPDSESGTTKFVEVISSPMQVVSDFWGRQKFGGYEDAPSLDSRRIVSNDPLLREEQKNHFVTIEFSSAGGTRVNMRVKYWPILPPDSETAPEAVKVYEFSLA